MDEKIIQSIKSTITEYKIDNQIECMWKEPIIEIISVKNINIEFLRKTVSNEHLAPNDILPDAKSIICFFIPFHEFIVNSNVTGKFASREWALAYIKTNDLIKKINENIENLMNGKKYKTGKIPAAHNFDKVKLLSNWSHRHIAYLAGLGTFGLNNMVITEFGCCGRFGSIIINYECENYKKIDKMDERCLNKLNGSCAICVNRCKNGVYENNKFNRQQCYEQCLKNAKKYENLGLADVCGKCLVNIPCSTKIP